MQKTASELLVWYFERHKVKILDATTLTFIHSETGRELPVRFNILGTLTHIDINETSIMPDESIEHG